jgi:tRNA threonylcarbamoyladenosine biosynthesis protein TsaE
MSDTSLTLTSSGPDDTRALAAALASLLRAGDVVALAGELGAGKTCFVQGAVRGLGVEARVTSPTFVLVRHYQGRLPVVHCDVYRLDRLQDVHDLGDDVLAPDVVTFLEWADAVQPLLPEDRLEVVIRLPTDGVSGALPGTEAPADDEPREVIVRACGPTWERRSGSLAEVLTPWGAPGDPGTSAPAQPPARVSPVHLSSGRGD